MPEYYIIPQSKLAKVSFKNHREWLAAKTTRKDTMIRIFDPYRWEVFYKFGEKYRNNWNILNLE